VLEFLWSEYQRLGTLAAVGRLHGRNGTSLRQLFQKHGLRQPQKPASTPKRGHRLGQFVRTVKFMSDARLLALMARQSRVLIPPEIRYEWRLWPAAKRQWFGRALQARIDAQHPEMAMPTTPLAPGFERFDYFSPRAIALAEAANSGRAAQSWEIHLRLSSRGLIWREQLWYWSWDDGHYYEGPFRRGKGREALHQAVWRAAGRTIPPRHVLRFKDGNRNNIRAENLELWSRAQVAVENRHNFFNRKAVGDLAVFLDMTQTKKANASHELVRSLGTRSHAPHGTATATPNPRIRRARRDAPHQPRQLAPQTKS
jgi:hypothetical protein